MYECNKPLALLAYVIDAETFHVIGAHGSYLKYVCGEYGHIVNGDDNDNPIHLPSGFDGEPGYYVFDDIVVSGGGQYDSPDGLEHEDPVAEARSYYKASLVDFLYFEQPLPVPLRSASEPLTSEADLLKLLADAYSRMATRLVEELSQEYAALADTANNYNPLLRTDNTVVIRDGKVVLIQDGADLLGGDDVATMPDGSPMRVRLA